VEPIAPRDASSADAAKEDLAEEKSKKIDKTNKKVYPDMAEFP
jgi:hypothetical protein